MVSKRLYYTAPGTVVVFDCIPAFPDASVKWWRYDPPGKLWTGYTGTPASPTVVKTWDCLGGPFAGCANVPRSLAFKVSGGSFGPFGYETTVYRNGTIYEGSVLVCGGTATAVIRLIQSVPANAFIADIKINGVGGGAICLRSTCYPFYGQSGSTVNIFGACIGTAIGYVVQVGTAPIGP